MRTWPECPRRRGGRQSPWLALWEPRGCVHYLQAPCTYKKKEVNRLSTGTPRSFFDFLRGVLTHIPHASHRGLPRPVLLRHGVPRRIRRHPFVLLRSRCWLYSPRLEKRSQALQACNLTRNIQADGAPMVHGPLEPSPGVFFSPPSDTGVMPWKTHRDPAARRRVPRFSLCAGAVDCSSSSGRSNVAHAPIGNSPKGGS
jgi:hypothetical protein